MKKISILLMTILVMFSCGEHEDVIYDPNTDQTLVFFNTTSTTLEVLINETLTADIVVAATTLSSSPRTVNVTVDEELTTANSDDYSFSGSVTIPANEYFGSLAVTAIDNTLTVDPVTLTLKIDSVDEAGAVASSTKHTISMFETCPLEDGFALGDYMLTHVSGGVPAASFSPVFGDGIVVELVQGASDTERTFNVKCYPAFGFSNPPSDFAFSLICEEVIAYGIVDGQLTGVGCGSSIELGPAVNTGSFTIDDDSFITIIFAEDVGGASCGDEGETTVTLTKVI